jgi:hypothetical protein
MSFLEHVGALALTAGTLLGLPLLLVWLLSPRDASRERNDRAAWAVADLDWWLDQHKAREVTITHGDGNEYSSGWCVRLTGEGGQEALATGAPAERGGDWLPLPDVARTAVRRWREMYGPVAVRDARRADADRLCRRWEID